MIRIRAVSFDETRFCCFGFTDLMIVDKVLDIHIYSPDEVDSSPPFPSYELPYLFTELRFKEGVTTEEKEDFDFDLDTPSDYLFLPVSDVERLPFVDCGTFPSLYEATETLRKHRPVMP